MCIWFSIVIILEAAELTAGYNRLAHNFERAFCAQLDCNLFARYIFKVGEVHIDFHMPPLEACAIVHAFLARVITCIIICMSARSRNNERYDYGKYMCKRFAKLHKQGCENKKRDRPNLIFTMRRVNEFMINYNLIYTWFNRPIYLNEILFNVDIWGF